MGKSPFQYNPTLTAISLAYQNPSMSLIADEVLPLVPVETEAFEYLSFPKADQFTVPDTRVGRTGKVNEVEFGGTLVTSMTEDYGLEESIPSKDTKNGARMGYDPLARATSYLTNLIQLDREVRTSAKVFGAANYAAANKTTLTSTGQWSHADSDPVAAILAVMESMTMKGNILVLGRATWTALRQNVNMVKKVLGSASTTGLLTRQQVADALELSKILVGESLVNTARKGQAAVLARTWGKHAALIYQDLTADTKRGITYGYTAEFENRITGTIMDDPDVGLRGGSRVRVGMSVKELVLADDLGYLWTNATA